MISMNQLVEELAKLSKSQEQKSALLWYLSNKTDSILQQLAQTQTFAYIEHDHQLLATTLNTLCIYDNNVKSDLNDFEVQRIMHNHDQYIQIVLQQMRQKTGCNFKSVSIYGDGNCLYRSAAQIYKGSQHLFPAMRHELIQKFVTYIQNAPQVEQTMLIEIYNQIEQQNTYGDAIVIDSFNQYTTDTTIHVLKLNMYPEPQLIEIAGVTDPQRIPTNFILFEQYPDHELKNHYSVLQCDHICETCTTHFDRFDYYTLHKCQPIDELCQNMQNLSMGSDPLVQCEYCKIYFNKSIEWLNNHSTFDCQMNPGIICVCQGKYQDIELHQNHCQIYRQTNGELVDYSNVVDWFLHDKDSDQSMGENDESKQDSIQVDSEQYSDSHEAILIRQQQEFEYMRRYMKRTRVFEFGDDFQCDMPQNFDDYGEDYYNQDSDHEY